MVDETVLGQLAQAAIVPVLVLERAQDAVPLAEAILAGGLRAIEVTLRTTAALDALIALVDEPTLSELVIGAGTVRTPRQALDVIGRGVRFVVSPGFDQDIVDVCRAHNVAVLPGVATATEIMQANRAGLNAVKFFPAEAMGGLPALEALAAPFFDLTFMPTGGIAPSNVNRYLDHRQVIAVGGSWMVPPTAIGARDWDQISALAAQCASIVAAHREPGAVS